MEPALLAAVRDQLSARDTRDMATREDPRSPRGPTRSERFHILQNNTLALFRAGVPIVLGTDAGVTGAFHGWASIHELELLTAAGLPPLQALMAGTTNAAKVLHVEDRGSIRAGKLLKAAWNIQRIEPDNTDNWIF
jgi:imidazolonepropionase-like amidohydrolase